jgi:hypothetical protein
VRRRRAARPKREGGPEGDAHLKEREGDGEEGEKEGDDGDKKDEKGKDENEETHQRPVLLEDHVSGELWL